MLDFLFETENFDWKSNIPQLQQRSGLDLRWLYAKDFRLVQNVDQLYDLVEYLKDKEFIALDTETTGLDFNCKTVSVQLTAEENVSYFIPIRMNSSENISPAAFVKALKPTLESQDNTILAFNAKFDGNRLRSIISLNNGIDIFVKPVIDLQIYYKLQDPDAPLTLKQLTNRKLAIQQLELSHLFKRTAAAKAAIRFNTLPLVDAIPYACSDTDCTFNIFLKDKEKILQAVSTDKINKLEHKVQAIIADMEAMGVYIDKRVLDRARKECELEIEELDRKIKNAAGANFKINSPNDVANFLYNKLKLTPLAFTDKGAPSTGKEGLEPYRDSVEEVDWIMSYKEAAKLRTAFIDKIPEYCDENSRVHPNFNPLGTASGRFSCTDPNFQQLPKQRGSALGFRSAIRKSIKPRPGYILWDADYSQVEYRLFASMCGDPDLKQAFMDGLDFHKYSASMAFNVPYEEVTKLQRLKAKSVSFGILYGISSYGLAQQIGCSQAEAEEMIENYFNRFPRVKEWIEEVHHAAEQKKYIKTLFGRRRILKDLFSKDKSTYQGGLRKSVNSSVQGTAADILKMAFIRIDNVIKEKGYDVRLISTVHDEIVAEISLKEDILKVSKDLENAMNMDIPGFVPIKCEPAMGYDWGSLIELSDFDINKLDEYKAASDAYLTEEIKAPSSSKEEIKKVSDLTFTVPSVFSKIALERFKKVIAENAGDTPFMLQVDGRPETLKQAKSKVMLSSSLVQQLEDLYIKVEIPEYLLGSIL